MKLLLALVVVSLVFFAADSFRLPRPQLQQAVSISKKVTQLGVDWSSCNKPGDELKVKVITLTPDPPQPGKPVTIYAEFELDETVTNGTIAATVKVLGITIINKEFNLCTELEKLNQKCPLEANNDAKVSITEDLPNIPFKGTAKGHVVLTDQSGNELMCVDLDIKI